MNSTTPTPPTTTSFAVDGMTCGHCAQSVTAELSALAGVTNVDVQLVPGGSSPVTVTSDAPLTDAAIAEAVGEAGYAVTPRRSLL